MKAIILAGGFGTRLKSISGDLPKPMVPIAGKPFLEHQIDFLKDHNVTEIILAVHHMSDTIKSYFADGRRFGVKITYSEEESPLGTAGAIKNAERYIDGPFLVLNGDTYLNMELNKLIEAHKYNGNGATITLTESQSFNEYGNVVFDGKKVRNFLEKSSTELENKIINAGIYLFNPEILNYIESNKNVSLEKEIFPKLAKADLLGGYFYKGYFMDLGRPETHSKFKEDVMNALILSETDKIKDAMNKISKNKINLVLICDQNKKLLGVVNERIIREHLLKNGGIEDPLRLAMITDPITARITDNSETISHLLFEVGIHHLPVLDEFGILKSVEFHSEKIRTQKFPMVRGKAPLRISFAGGGTDIQTFFEKEGGVVISSTIDKYCYATIKKRADSKIHINSDIGEEVMIDSREEITYDGKFDIIKAIIKIINPEFGFDLYLNNDLPPGRGLGSSASLSVLIIKLICHLMDTHYDDYKIAEIAYKAEREELKINGGWQDQYAAITGGFNYMEFSKDKRIIYPLRLKEETVEELGQHLLLCYVGQSHYSDNQQIVLSESINKKEEDVVKSLNNLKNLAIEIKDALLTNELEEIGNLLHKSWEEKRNSSKKVTNPSIDNLYQTGIKNGASGGKLLGSGGGGYILFFYSPTKRNQLAKALKDSGGEILDFNFEFGGTKIWPVKNKI